jgi:predicted nucleic acid-binding protein
MITVPVACVVDASVGIKLVLKEPDSAKVKELFAHATFDPTANLYAPDLFFLECANILRTLSKKGLLAAANALTDLAEVQAQRLLIRPTAPLMAEALRIGMTHDLSAYDAVYVALADFLRLPLLTADQKLVNKLASTSFSVSLLSHVTIPPLPAPPS